MTISAILYIATGLLCLVCETKRILKERRLSMIAISLFFFGFLCCIIPGLIVYNNYEIKNSSNSDFVILTSYILTLITYISLRIGYFHERRKVAHINEQIHREGNKNILLSAFVFLCVSFIALYLWSSGYGGLLSVMLLGNQIRASFVESTNSFMFFKHLVPISIVSSLLMYTELFVNNSREHRFLKYILLLVSIIISLIYIIANDGRMLAGTYFLYFILISFKKKFEIEKQPVASIMLRSTLVIVFIFFIILSSERWFSNLRELEASSSESKTIIDVFMSEFHFIVSGLYSSINDSFNGIYHFTIFNDLLNGVFAWLPTSLKPIILDDVWDINTNILNDDGYGQSPTSIVAQSFYDLHILGVVVIPYFYARVIAKIEKALDGNTSTFGLVLYTTLAFYFGKGMAYFSIYNIMINLFFIVFSWILYKSFLSKI